jgi:hypothetical protein
MVMWDALRVDLRVALRGFPKVSTLEYSSENLMAVH